MAMYILSNFLLSCNQEEVVQVETNPTSTITKIKSSKAAYVAEGNLFIENNSDMTFPIELTNSANPNLISGLLNSSFLRTSFIMPPNQTVSIINMNSNIFTIPRPWFYKADSSTSAPSIARSWNQALNLCPLKLAAPLCVTASGGLSKKHT